MKKTRKLIPAKRPFNYNNVIRFGTHEFRFRKDFTPIPVEVPEKVALFLLQIDERCNCHKHVVPPDPMFKEVK